MKYIYPKKYDIKDIIVIEKKKKFIIKNVFGQSAAATQQCRRCCSLALVTRSLGPTFCLSIRVWRYWVQIANCTNSMATLWITSRWFQQSTPGR